MRSHQDRARSLARTWFVRVYVIITSSAWLVLGGLQMVRPVDPWLWVVVGVAFLPTALVLNSLWVVRFPYSVLGTLARRKLPVDGMLQGTRALVEVGALSRHFLGGLWPSPAKVTLFESGVGVRAAGLLVDVFLPWETVTEVILAPAMGGARILVNSVSEEVRRPIALYLPRKATKSGFVAALEHWSEATPGLRVIRKRGMLRQNKESAVS